MRGERGKKEIAIADVNAAAQIGRHVVDWNDD